jgi:hypothetical protein
LPPTSALTQALNDSSFFDEVMAMVDKYSKENCEQEPRNQHAPARNQSFPKTTPSVTFAPAPSNSLPRFLQNQKVPFFFILT